MIELSLPPYILFLIDRLESAGFEAYVVGGCVRNRLLGRPISDYDMTTSATPMQMKAVFSDCRVIETGIKHGTLTVISDEIPVEITTYRLDGKYSDHRKPESVTFTRNLRDDLARRDFTVNAMAYHPRTGLVDLYGGIDDLRNRIIRCVGEPSTRFEEDALRILRGIRFAATYGFRIEPHTMQAIHSCAPYLVEISAERKQAELTKTLLAPYTADTLPDFFDVFAYIIPTLDARENVWQQMLNALSRAPYDLSVRLAVFLSRLDLDEVSAALHALRFDRETSDAVTMILTHRNDVIGTTKTDIKRAMARFGVPMLQKLVAFWKTMHPHFDSDGSGEMISDILSSGEAYHRGMLKVNGRDLNAIGIQGRKTGAVLTALLDAVIDGKVENDYDDLLAYAKQI